MAGVWCGLSLATPGGSSCVLLPATPGWVSLPVVVCRSSPVLAGARRLWWFVSRVGVSFVVCVCGVCGFCAVAVLCCVSLVCGVCDVGGVLWWCGGCVFRVCWCVWLRVCGVPLVCGLVSPPLASPDHWPWAWFPATPGWGPLVVVVRALGALLLGLGVCVCAVWPFVLVWVAWGGVVRGVAAVRVRVCACGVWLVGCVIPWLVLVVGRRHGSKSRRRGPVDA